MRGVADDFCHNCVHGAMRGRFTPFTPPGSPFRRWSGCPLVSNLIASFTRTLLVLVGILALSVTGALAAGCDALVQGPSGRVVAVSDGDTITLDSGLVVRLVGIQAPKLPLGRAGFVAWPLGEESRTHLVDLVMDRTVTLNYGGERRDRHGRALAHLTLEGPDGPIWVQQAMLQAGLARVYSFPDNRACLPALYAAEAEARAERLGMWSQPDYALRPADRPEVLLAREGEYELVEGRVLSAARAGSWVYLNFGRVWREDFTIAIGTAGQRAFDDAGLDPLALEGHLIRVRGWIESHDGPRITVTHPEQVEILAAR